MIPFVVISAVLLGLDWQVPPSVLEQTLVNMRSRREQLYEELNELQSIAALLRRLDLTPEQIARLGESANLISDDSNSEKRSVVMAPLFNVKSPMRLAVRMLATGNSEVNSLWHDREGKPHLLKFQVNPRQQRVEFLPAGRPLRGAALRVVFPHRVQLAVTFEDGQAVLRTFNGPARCRFVIGRTSVVLKMDIDAKPLDEAPQELVTVLALTDDTIRFVLPAEPIDHTTAQNEEDRFFLQHFRTWSGSFDSVRCDEHRKFLEAYRNFDFADAPPVTPDPAAEIGASRRRLEMLTKLNTATRALHREMAQLNVRLLQLRATESLVLNRLRVLRQREFFEKTDALPEFLRELREPERRFGPNANPK